MIEKRKDGYHVVSESTGKNLGGPYQSREEAEHRLRQVEFFKNREKFKKDHPGAKFPPK